MSEQVGYRCPPKSRRFQKGVSGNPRGRPAGRKGAIPYDAVFGRMVKVIQGGVEKDVNAAEAFLLVMAKQALQGKTSAAIEIIKLFDRKKQGGIRLEHVPIIAVFGRDVYDLLGVGVSVDPFGPKSFLLIESWVVEEALSRFGERRLTPEEQKLVVEATRAPHKVHFPDWWTELPKRPGRGRPTKRIEPPPRSLPFFEELEEELPIFS